jgi:hypothetical protein
MHAQVFPIITRGRHGLQEGDATGGTPSGILRSLDNVPVSEVNHGIAPVHARATTEMKTCTDAAYLLYFLIECLRASIG